MKTKIITLTAILLMLAVGFTSCDEKETTPGYATGTIIGTYYFGGVGSYFVQVDKNFPIGKTFEHTESGLFCINLPEGSHRNMIQVQPFLPLPDWPTSSEKDFDWSKIEPIVGKRISFSYREFQRGEEGGYGGDAHLFIIRITHSVGLCAPPDNVPVYVITDCQIIK